MYICVPVVPHVAAVKMEAVEVANLVRSEKGKDVLVIKGFEFRFQKFLLTEWNDVVVVSGHVNATYSGMKLGRFSRVNVMQSHDADSEACLNRQIFHNCAKRRAKNLY
jgi:hypothetical protein